MRAPIVQRLIECLFESMDEVGRTEDVLEVIARLEAITDINEPAAQAAMIEALDIVSAY